MEQQEHGRTAFLKVSRMFFVEHTNVKALELIHTQGLDAKRTSFTAWFNSF